MERKITVGIETAKAIDLHTEFNQWSTKFARFIEERHGEDGFASVYGHVSPHLKALYDVLRYELGLSIEIDRDMDAGEQEQHQGVNDETFLMTSSVILAKQCLEDIEEVNDGKEFVERMMEAHRHLTEAIEITTRMRNPSLLSRATLHPNLNSYGSEQRKDIARGGRVGHPCLRGIEQGKGLYQYR